MSAAILLATAISATGGPALETTVELRGASYLDARARLLEGHPVTGPSAAVRADNWRRVVLQQALHAYRKAPELLERTRDVPGLRPEVFRKARRAQPTATRDVASWPAEVVLEHLAFVGDAAVADRSAQARFALRHAVIMAAGRSRHPAARFALQAVLSRPGESVQLRSAAAEALGLTGAKAAVGTLVALVQDAAEPLSVREAALAGLGGLRFSESLAALTAWMDPEQAPSARIAVSALGRLGSARLASPALRAGAAEALYRALLDARHDRKLVVEALGRVAHPPTAERLAAYAQDEAHPEALRARAEQAARRMQRTLRRLSRR